MRRDMRLACMGAALLLAAFAAQAQVPADDPDWREVEAPAPPALKLQGLNPLEVDGSGLRFGIDPASIAIGEDGIVRYVVVATSASGVVNAMYEGIRCGSGDYKLYARHSASGGWQVVKNGDWRSLWERPGSRHTLLIARAGACMGRAANRSAANIVQDLRTPVERRYQLGE
jgi:hypothetical protein